MFDRRRLQYLTFGGWLVVAILLAVPVSAQQGEQEPPAPVNETNGVSGENPPPDNDSGKGPSGEQAPPDEPPPTIVAVEGEPSAKPSDDALRQGAADRDKADLVAQQRMADSTENMVVLTRRQLRVGVIGTGFLIFTLFLNATAAWTATIAAKAAINANKLHERAQRAWLKITPELLSNIQFDKSGNAKFKVKFFVENIGNSPAFAVSIHTDIYLHASDWLSPALKQLEFANAIRNSHDNATGSIVFPEGDWKHTPELEIWSNEAAAARKQTKEVDGEDDEHLRVFVIGCVQYLTTLDDKNPSQTGFIYALRVRREGQTPGWVPDGVSIKRSDTVLEERSLDPLAVT